MNDPTDEMFRSAYAVHERDHAAQREAMLGALPQEAPIARRLRLRIAVAAFAAVLLGGLGIAGFVALRPSPAFGLDGLHERLQSLRSIYVKGWEFQRTKTKFGTATLRFPIERYYERPSRYYNTGYGFGSQGNDDLVQVTSSYSANDGQRSLMVLRDQKKAILQSNVDPLETELYVENAMQQSELEQQLTSKHPEEFERVGSERLNGVWCDIYQSKVAKDFWRRIWINPTDGLPVRVLGMTRGPDGNEQPDYDYTEIRTNADPPAKLFSFEVPKGFEVIEMKESPKSRSIQPTGSAAGYNHFAGAWIGLKIDDRAALVCWTQYFEEKEKKLWFHDAPRLVLRGATDRKCSEQTLYEMKSGDLNWRWSLIFPDDKKPLGLDPLYLKFSGPKHSISLGVQPLVFSPARLAEMVEKVQRRSLEESSDLSAAKSLEQLREIIAAAASKPKEK